MGASELRNLNCRDFIAAIDESLDLDDINKENLFKVAVNLKDKRDLIGKWKIRRFKTNMPYITFNSPESTLATVDYIFYRYKMNKPIKNSNDFSFYNQDNVKRYDYIKVTFEKVKIVPDEELKNDKHNTRNFNNNSSFLTYNILKSESSLKQIF